MQYYLKRAILPWVYLVFMTILSLSVHAVENVVLKYVFMSATLLLYLFTAEWNAKKYFSPARVGSPP